MLGSIPTGPITQEELDQGVLTPPTFYRYLGQVAGRIHETASPAPHPRTLIVISDGLGRYTEAQMDRATRAIDDVASRARDAGLRIVTIGGGMHGPDWRPLLARAAERTGGTHATFEDPAALTAAIGAVADRLRGQYVIDIELKAGHLAQGGSVRLRLDVAVPGGERVSVEHSRSVALPARR